MLIAQRYVLGVCIVVHVSHTTAFEMRSVLCTQLIAKQRNGKDLRHHDDSYGDHQSDLHKEKEKQLQEVLKNITELKAKIQRQQAGFDEMALSLQVQLDDKEYKATQVANAFKAR
jgi:hypothetical protein